VDGRNGRNPASPNGWLRPQQNNGIYKPSINWCRISQPSTVCILYIICIYTRKMVRLAIENVSGNQVVHHQNPGVPEIFFSDNAQLRRPYDA
jgi:hypothetical protein